VKRRRHSLLRYLPPNPDLSSHFKITRGISQLGFDTLPCLLARLWPDGKFELINRHWDMLGYSAEELAGRGVGELMALEGNDASATVRALLSEGAPMEFALHHKDGREVGFRWNRQYDDFSSSMFVVGEELPEPVVQGKRKIQ
jgi:PAS domain S-box-containing protein